MTGERKSLFPFPSQVAWCVVFRSGDMPWRLWSEHGTHHGASLELSVAEEGRDWEFRIAKKRSTWEWDDLA